MHNYRSTEQLFQEIARTFHELNTEKTTTVNASEIMTQV